MSLLSFSVSLDLMKSISYSKSRGTVLRKTISNDAKFEGIAKYRSTCSDSVCRPPLTHRLVKGSLIRVTLCRQGRR
jgi:hypothetical protein